MCAQYVVCGDLNYRMASGTSTMEVLGRCAARRRSAGCASTTGCARCGGPAFVNWEAPIAFMPTYKLQPRTDQYEQRPEKKLRAGVDGPRLMACAQLTLANDTFGGIIEATLSAGDAPRCRALDYSSAALDMSDHKPVRAVLELQVRHIIRAERRAVLSQVTRRLDQWENEMQPTAELECSSLSFDDVRFGADCAQTRAMRIRNTGEVRLVYRLIAKPREERDKPCLIKPTYGMLLPGETSELRATVCVAAPSPTRSRRGPGCRTSSIRRGRPRLLRHHQRELPSLRLRRPAGNRHERARGGDRSSRDGKHMRREQKAGDNTTQPLYVPKELWRCVDFLCVNAAARRCPAVTPPLPRRCLAAGSRRRRGSPPARRCSSFPSRRSFVPARSRRYVAIASLRVCASFPSRIAPHPCACARLGSAPHLCATGVGADSGVGSPNTGSLRRGMPSAVRNASTPASPSASSAHSMAERCCSACAPRAPRTTCCTRKSTARRQAWHLFNTLPQLAADADIFVYVMSFLREALRHMSKTA